ncbi:MAG TPA: c-type cytochrome [Casimicrobiaceae bacterium]|nr:c-type cytochrome [Casimicrobiaceae bacterium]
MSDANSPLIKTWQQLVAVVVAAFIVPIVVILLIASLITSGRKSGTEAGEAAVLARIQPVGNVVLAGGPRVALAADQVYAQVCKTCHDPGIAGAPKFGDKAAWASVIKQGDKLTVERAINGFQGKRGVMPAKGGNPDLTDAEVHAAVVHMINAAGGNWKPPAPSATATAPAAAPAATPAAQAPVVTAAIPPPRAAAPSDAKADGKKIYDGGCNACHTPGIAGAPKLGDKANWTPRIAQGVNVLYEHSIKGYQGKAGVMPPKGGNASLSDADVKAAVDYMTAAAK